MSSVAANPRFLINLKELLDGGHITEEEFVEQRRSLLAPTATTSSTLETTLAALASTQVELLRFLTSGTWAEWTGPTFQQGEREFSPHIGMGEGTKGLVVSTISLPHSVALDLISLLMVRWFGR